MALGTLVIDKDIHHWGEIDALKITVPLDNSYPTGGYTDFAGTYLQGARQFRKILAVLPLATAGYVVEYVEATDKLKLYWSADGAAAVEVTNATDLALVSLKLLVLIH